MPHDPSPSSTRNLGLLSVVAPVYNEEGSVRTFCDRVTAALAGVPLEIVLVDDGSKDSSPEILEAMSVDDPRIKVILLARNFGHQAALTAGLDHAAGDVVVMLDADLQDPPELIPTMLDRWREGSDVVYAVRDGRAGESRFKLRSASWFYRVFDWLATTQLQHNAGDFRLFDRVALNALLAMRERNRFLRGMSVWVGYTQTAVPYQRDRRHSGETKFTLGKMLRFAFDAISSFSYKPLQLASMFGVLLSAIALISIPIVAVLRIAGHYLPGFGTVEISILFLGGIQLLSIGIIGEYVGRIFDEVKGRPLYLVRDVINAERQEPQASEPPALATPWLGEERRRGQDRRDHV